MSENNDKVFGRIRGLLAKAESVSGTPEADTFRAKAFELMAKYGVSEMDAHRAGETTGSGDLLRVTFAVPDPFAYERMILLAGISAALHCSNVRTNDHEVVMFGTRRNIERVKVLHTILSQQMLSEVQKTVPPSPFGRGTGNNGQGAFHEHRASWMRGFAQKVYERLMEAESNAAQSSQNPEATTALVKDDKQRARSAANKAFPNLTNAVVKSGGTGYKDGARVAGRADIGATRVGGGRTAIGA